MDVNLPPLLLVETWLDIADNNKFPEAQQIAHRNLNTCFGDVSDARLYVEMKRLEVTGASLYYLG